MEWAIFGSAFTLLFILIGILGDHLRVKRKIKFRELQLQERIAAMEKGLPIPEFSDTNGIPVNGTDQHKRKVQWFRMTALSIGMIFTFAGFGMGMAFHFSADSGFHGLATIGMIPFMAGLGLLLFY